MDSTVNDCTVLAQRLGKALQEMNPSFGIHGQPEDLGYNIIRYKVRIDPTLMIIAIRNVREIIAAVEQDGELTYSDMERGITDPHIHNLHVVRKTN